MLPTVLFLITCIITARFLDKHRMRVASTVYSVLFCLFFFALLFITDAEPVRRALTALFGEHALEPVSQALRETVASPVYGLYITAAIAVTAVLQSAAAVCCLVSTLLRLYKKSTLFYASLRDRDGYAPPLQTLFLCRRINLIYCRMLN